MNMPLPSVMTALMKTSVWINGLLIPGRSAAKVLQRYCRPVCFFNEGSEYELSSAGSCLLFRYRRRCMAFFAKHQLGKENAAREAREFCIIVDDGGDGKIALTPNAVASPRYHLPEHGFGEDVQFVEYETQRGSRDLAPHFLDLDLDSRPDLRSVAKDQLMAVFTIGYPTGFISYDIAFDEEFLPQDVSVTHRFSKLILSNDWTEGMELHLTLRQHEKYPETIKDLDGFSGSPVFFFYKEEDHQVQLGFAGMVRLGGNGVVHLYEAAQIKRLLDHLFPRSSQNSSV